MTSGEEKDPVHDVREFLVVTNSPEETKLLGRRLASYLRRGDVVSLEGELGAGKTQFAKGVADFFGLDGDRDVTSPTFTIVNVYRGRETIFHIDLYRLEGDHDELSVTGFFEYLGGGGISLIEWGERAKLYLPSDTIKVILFHLNAGERKIRVIVPSSRTNIIEGLLSTYRI